MVIGGITLLFIKGLESSLGAATSQSHFKTFGVAALIGGGAIGLACAAATGRLWYRAS